MRLIGAALLEANDDWQLQHRYLQIEGMAELHTGPADGTCLMLRHKPHDPWPPQITPEFSTILTDVILPRAISRPLASMVLTGRKDRAPRGSSDRVTI